MNEFKPIKQEKTVISIRLDVDMLKKLMNCLYKQILAVMNLLFSVLIMHLKSKTIKNFLLKRFWFFDKYKHRYE